MHPRPSAAAQNPYAAAIPAGQPTGLTAPRAAGDPRASGDQIPATEYKHPSEANIDNAIGQPYVIYRGLTLDTVLMNRLDGDAVQPGEGARYKNADCIRTITQHILVPEGTIVLGGHPEDRRRRVRPAAANLRRLPSPVDAGRIQRGQVDQFHGLDQIGEEGLKDQVNNHYMQIFGTSIALGVIAGAAQIESGRIESHQLRFAVLFQRRCVPALFSNRLRRFSIS